MYHQNITAIKAKHATRQMALIFLQRRPPRHALQRFKQQTTPYWLWTEIVYNFMCFRMRNRVRTCRLA